MIFIAGLIAMFGLPISEYPEVVPPSVVVRAIYPGANPRVISEAVATPLEEQINGVENMLYMSSQSTSDGVLTLTVTFRVGTDVDLAQVQVQNRVSQALPRLPEEVRQLGVTTVKSSPNFIMVVHLLSPDNRYDVTYLRNYGLLQVKDVLARIPGIGQVQVFGGGDYSMRVWLDPGKVAARGLSATDVVNAIREQNVQVAAGVVGAPPMPMPVDYQLSINARGRLDQRGGVRRHHPQDRRQRRDHPAPRRGPAGAGGGRLRASLTAEREGSGRHRHLPGAGLQCPAALEHGARDHGGAAGRTSPRAWSIGSSTTPRSTCATASARW